MNIPYSKLYKKVILIRKFEELLLDLFSKGELFGTTHTYVGQEAIAVSAIAHLNDSDIVFSNHRCHGHFLAKENDPLGLLAEIMGRKEGVCGGRGGSQHLQKNNFYSNGIQGGIIANSLGMAFAEKFKGLGNIAMVFIGDGTWGEGIVYESLNMASLWNIPLLIVVENNRYAQSTPIELNLSGSIVGRSKAFDIKVDQVESNDIAVLYPKFELAVNYVRQEQKPFIQIVDTYRLNAHSKGDDDRLKEEVEQWRKKDPLIYFKERVPEQKLEEINIETDNRLKEIVEIVSKMDFANL